VLEALIACFDEVSAGAPWNQASLADASFVEATATCVSACGVRSVPRSSVSCCMSVHCRRRKIMPVRDAAAVVCVAVSAAVPPPCAVGAQDSCTATNLTGLGLGLGLGFYVSSTSSICRRPCNPGALTSCFSPLHILQPFFRRCDKSQPIACAASL